MTTKAPTYDATEVQLLHENNLEMCCLRLISISCFGIISLGIVKKNNDDFDISESEEKAND